MMKGDDRMADETKKSKDFTTGDEAAARRIVDHDPSALNKFKFGKKDMTKIDKKDDES